MDTIHRNLQESQQQQPQIMYMPNSAMGHYETLAMYMSNGSVTENETKQEEPQPDLEQKQQQGAIVVQEKPQPDLEQKQQQGAIVVDGQQHKADSNDGGNNRVPYIEASYITPLADRTVTHTISNGDGYGLEYSDVANPSPPTPNKNEHKKVNSVKKGKRPESSDEYTDPIHNGVANMRRLKATSVNSKTPDTPSDEGGNSKQRRASESAAGAAHRKDFEEWPIKSPSSNATPAHESDL